MCFPCIQSKKSIILCKSAREHKRLHNHAAIGNIFDVEARPVTRQGQQFPCQAQSIDVSIVSCTRKCPMKTTIYYYIDVIAMIALCIFECRVPGACNANKLCALIYATHIIILSRSYCTHPQEQKLKRRLCLRVPF